MDIIVSVVTGLLLIIGALGTILPVLPGSVLVIVGLLVWAIGIGGVVGWSVFAIGGLLAILGMSASTVLTGKRLKQREIPNSSILIGAITGVAGAFLIPVVGLFAGFVVGLYASEWYRLREPHQAWQASVLAMKSVGMGMLIEFSCAGLAMTIWVIGLFVHFRS